MRLLVDCFLVLLACNQVNPYFVAGETFGFSSMQEPSWSSSFSENDIPEVERHDDPVVQTVSTPKFTSPYTTTTPSPPPVITKPVFTTRRPKRPTTRRNRPVSRGVEEDRTPVGEGSPEGGDRSQVLSTILAFKNIVRSIQSEMNEVRTSCDVCSEDRNNYNTVDTCASSKEADAKIKQQLRDLKSSVRNIDATLVQLQNTINTIGVHMSGVQPRDCMDMFVRGQTANGVFYIHPIGQDRPFLVYCDMFDGGGWTFIQKREEGDGVDFDRGMGSYRRGFGDPNYSHWLGLDKIRSLVSQDEYELRIEVELYNGRTANAHYSYFKIGDYASNYALEIGNYNGTAGDSLSFHNGLPFTTRDRDNDHARQHNCAAVYKGGWWYANCLYVNLNGPHIGQQDTESSALGIIWYDLTGFHSSLRATSMAIRPTY